MKGQMKILADMFMALLTIALFIALYFTFEGVYLDFRVKIVGAEYERSLINIAQVLLSSDKLVYSNGFQIYRGILDETKLASLQKDSSKLFEEISQKNYMYSINIENLDSKNSWSIGEKFDANIKKSFPVAIKHGNEIQIGKMTLNLVIL